MKGSTFFSEQARKPSGIFGRLVMSAVFDLGNAFMNGFVSDLLAVEPGDRVLDITLNSRERKHQLFHCVVARTKA